MSIKNKKSKNNIFIWSPMISHIGTIRAAIGMAKAFKRFTESKDGKVFLVNVFGEFNSYEKNSDFILLNIFNKFSFYKTGIISKILIYVFTLLTLPFLIYFIVKFKPKIIVTCLVGYLPNILKFFFKDLVIINSIQGYPKINNLRKFIWKKTYLKSDHLITMTNITKQKLIEDLNFKNSKITKIDNPIISREIRLMANKKLDDQDLEIFKKKVFCSIGRLTRQKNYLEMLKGFNFFSKEFNNNFNLIIIGEGEQRAVLEQFIKQEKITNCFLLGFKKNPYRYLSKSSFYLSSSLWEEPGHTLIEAGYLNIPILSSDCPNGPREVINHNINGFKYKTNDLDDLKNKMNYVSKIEENKLYEIKLNMKKAISSFSEFKFYKKIQLIL